MGVQKVDDLVNLKVVEQDYFAVVLKVFLMALKMVAMTALIAVELMVQMLADWMASPMVVPMVVQTVEQKELLMVCQSVVEKG